jgi:hypothetical protein
VTEQTLVRAAYNFQTQLSATDPCTFCEQKAALSEDNPAEKETWDVLRLLFEEDPKHRIMSKLGFAVPAASLPLRRPEKSVTAAVTETEVSDEDFFNSLSREDSKQSRSEHGSALQSPVATSVVAAAAAKVIETSDERDEINDAVIAGEFSAAVRLCFNKGRDADALLFASMGDFELWQQTQQLYLEKHPRRFVRTVAKAIVGGDITAYVESSDLERWRETLAVAMNYVPAEESSAVIARLGRRLESNGQLDAAVMCFLVAMDVDSAVCSS